MTIVFLPTGKCFKIVALQIQTLLIQSLMRISSKYLSRTICAPSGQITRFSGTKNILVTKILFCRHGYYFVVNDLSTSGRSGSSNLIPAIRVGHLRLRVLFSEALPLDLACILHCEFPGTMYVNKTGHVTGSYI